MSDDKTTPKGAEEIKAEVIEKYGLDGEDHEELIEQLTNEALDNQKKLSKTIEQKTKYRQQLVDKGLIDPETFEPIEKADAEPEKKQVKDNTSTTTEQLSKEEVILIAKGFDEDDLDRLKVIQAGYTAMGKQISLKEAQEDPMFKSYIKSKEDQEKSEKAQLSASNKSNFATGKDGKPLTDEEHYKLWKKETGN